MGSIPGSGRFPGEGNGNLLQQFCLGNPLDRGAWLAIVHEVIKCRTQLSIAHSYKQWWADGSQRAQGMSTEGSSYLAPADC